MFVIDPTVHVDPGSCSTGRPPVASEIIAEFGEPPLQIEDLADHGVKLVGIDTPTQSHKPGIEKPRTRTGTVLGRPEDHRDAARDRGDRSLAAGPWHAVNGPVERGERVLLDDLSG
ncbi:hypothetical protein GCM10009743_68090 [Kribbella swartbergensis]